jgi:uncharacterized protein YnzC (UPF0291/DUF896 family)
MILDRINILARKEKGRKLDQPINKRKLYDKEFPQKHMLFATGQVSKVSGTR